jgi:hypothetical protein
MLRTLFGALLALIMTLTTVSGIAAQDASTPEAEADAAPTGESAISRGLDAPAVFFSERGDPIATVSVLDVERGWEDYGEFYEPERGAEYVAVTFEVNVVDSSNLVLEAYDFSLVDSFGRNNSRAFVDVAEGSDTVVFDEDVAVASGETAEVLVIFQVYEDADLGFFMWQPDSGVIVAVDLTEV